MPRNDEYVVMWGCTWALVYTSLLMRHVGFKDLEDISITAEISGSRDKLVPFEIVSQSLDTRETSERTVLVEGFWYNTPSRILTNVRAFHAAWSNTCRYTCFRFLRKTSGSESKHRAYYGSRDFFEEIEMN